MITLHSLLFRHFLPLLILIFLNCYSSAEADKPLWNQGGMIGDVDGLTISPSGQLWAVGGGFEQIKIGKVSDGSVLCVLYDELRTLHNLIFSADEQHIIAADYSPIHVWNIATQSIEREFELRKGDQILSSFEDTEEIAVALSADNHVLATAGKWSLDNTYVIALWNFSDGSLLYTIDLQNREVLSLIFCPDNNTLIYSLSDGSIVVWDIALHKSVRTGTIPGQPGQPGFLTSMTCSPVGGMFAGITQVNSQNYVLVLNTATLQIVRSFETDYYVRRVDFSPNGELIVFPRVNGRSADIRNIASGQSLGIITSNHLHLTNIFCLPFATENVVLMDHQNGGIADIVTLATQKTERTILPSFSKIARLAFSPDGKLLASLLEAGTISVFESASGRTLREAAIPFNMVDDQASLVFSPNNALVAVSGNGTINGKKIFLWNLDNPSQNKELTGHTDKVMCTAFSSDSRYLASCGMDKSIIIYDMQSGSIIDKLSGYDKPLYFLHWSPEDTALIAVGAEEDFTGEGNEVIEWSRSTKELTRYPGIALEDFLFDPYRVTASANGQFVLIRETLWDRWNDKELTLPLGHNCNNNGITSDGKYVGFTYFYSVGDTNSSIELWNTITRSMVFKGSAYDYVHYSKSDEQPVPLHERMALSQDGHYVAVGTNDGSIAVWETGMYTSVSESAPVQSSTNFSAYPNPVADELTIIGRTGESGPIRATLHTLMGTCISVLPLESNKGEFRGHESVHHLPAGLYYYEVLTRSGRQTIPVVIIH